MNRIYKVIWSKVKHQYVVVSELAHSCTKSTSSRIGRSAAAVLAALVLTTGVGALSVQAADPLVEDPYAILNDKIDETDAHSSDPVVTLVKSPVAAMSDAAPLAEGDEGQSGVTALANPTGQPEQHTIYNENGFYAHNGNSTYNALTNDGLWVGGDAQTVGFHVDNEGNLFTNGTATFKQGADMGGKKITHVANGVEGDDAVNMSQLTDVDNKIRTNTAGDGISVVDDAAGKTSTISVKLKDGENNLAVDKDGLSLKSEVTLDKVTSDNFTVDGTNISLTNAGLVMGDTTKLTSDGLTTGKVTVGNVVLDSTTNKITGLANGSAPSDAVNMSQLTDVDNKIRTNTAGDGISVVDDAAGKTSTISVKLKDGENNLAVDKDGLSLKSEVTLDKVTSDNFTVDGTNISLTNAGLVMGDTTKLTSDGLTTGKVTVGNVVLDSTTNKITGLANGSAPSDAVNMSQLTDVDNKIRTNTAGDGISVVDDAAGKTSTISVKLKDGENNLAVDKDGLSLKSEVTLDKVTSDNFTVDGTNISLTNAGLVMGDTTKLTSDGLTTGKVTVGNVVLDSTTNKITGLANGSAPSDAVNMSQLTDVDNKIRTNTAGDGISVVDDAAGKTSTISVKLKDGENNLAVDKDGLSLKSEVTLDKVTSDNFTVDGTNISLTNAGLVMGDTTKLTSDGLTTGKVTVGNVVLDSTTNKITGLANGSAPSDAVNMSQLTDVDNKIRTNTAGDGISVVDDAAGKTSTISVKLKDGENNLAVDKDGLSLKSEVTLDKVTSDNFTVDGTNISLTNAGLVMGDTTKLTSDGLTTGKVTVGNVVLDSTTNKITGLVTDGSNGSEAVSVDYLKDYVSTAGVGKAYAEGNGISIVNGIDNNPSTISVKLKDGEQNLAVDKDGLSLKPEVTLDKVTSDNFTVDGTNISLTNAGLVMGDTTKLTSDGLTTTVGNVVLDSTTNKITGGKRKQSV